jgi:hypothetical protein
MTAWRNGSARGGHQLVIGAHEGNSSIEQDKGRLNLVRFRPGDTPRVGARTGGKVKVRVPVASDGSRSKDVVIRSAHLKDLREGDEIYVEGLTRTGIARHPYNVLIKSEVYTARSRGAPTPGAPAATPPRTPRSRS